MLLREILSPQKREGMQLLICCLGAILGHHGGWLGKEENTELDAGPLWAGWHAEVGELLGRPIDASTRQRVERALRTTQKRRALSTVMDQVASLAVLADTWPLMAYLIRTLRLSDQKATEEGTDGG
jgi:hypothetical protein